MRRKVFIALLAAMAMNVFAQNFTIKGRFTDVSNDTLLISYTMREPDKKVIDVKVPIDEEGCFKYSCDIGYAYDAGLTVQSNGNKSSLFFVPDESIEIEGPSVSDNYWTIGGSEFYQRWDSVRQSMLPLLREFDAAAAKYEKGVADGLDKEMLADERTKANRDINKRLWKMGHQYIMSHLDDEVSATILLRQDYRDILPAIRMLSPEVRNGRFKDYLDVFDDLFSRLDKEQRAEKSAVLELKEGRRAPDFTLKDTAGNEFALSSLFGKGKYVVVDFWGSWCSWCIKGFPKMKEYYDKYIDKLEIVGVACYDKEDKWKNAVSRSNIPWINVFSPDGTTEVRFGVTAYPYKVVISPDGKVEKCFRGETDDFYKMLDEKLK